MFSKILIANRGEIAVRIIRACNEMGIRTVAVYSEADAQALHVNLADESYCIGPALLKDSYLNMTAIIDVAIATGCQAIHPGYGLLSENPRFAELCEKCNIKFIGPHYSVIARMGDKDEARRTMKAAQELYEGVEIEGMGAVGLITYMRTDSLRLSEDALKDAADYILERWGKKYLPDTPRHFKTKKNAQDGHEAIRPTMPSLSPDQVKESLSSDQYKLYKLIWERFIACQMANCLQSTTQAEISAKNYIFKASGYTVTFDGFTVLYEEKKDEDSEDSGALPPLEKDMPLRCKEIAGNQHFTQPPARYTEASLIKALEENGIGRPSTYATTISTITGREYVIRDGKALKPTELGEVITKLMKERFPKIVNVKFTAQVEEELDEVQSGKINWVETLHDFYGDFEKTLKKAKEEMQGVKIQLKEDETDIICEKCGRKMVVKMGRYGKFIACPGYPECKNVKKLVQETGAECPKCGGKVIVKKSKKGRIFYGCAEYPNCDFISWDEPSMEKCPRCGKTLLKKKGKHPKYYCITPDCGYERVEHPDEENKDEA